MEEGSKRWLRYSSPSEDITTTRARFNHSTGSPQPGRSDGQTTDRAAERSMGRRGIHDNLQQVSLITDDKADLRAAGVTSEASVQGEFQNPACGTFGRFPLNQQETRRLSVPYLTDAQTNSGRFAVDKDFLQFRTGPKMMMGRKRNWAENETDLKTKIPKTKLVGNWQICSFGAENENEIRSVSNLNQGNFLLLYNLMITFLSILLECFHLISITCCSFSSWYICS